jgi:hypothetical protein
MKNLGDIIKEGEYRNANAQVRKFRAVCTPADFKDKFLLAVSGKLYGGNFIIDHTNKEVINQLYYYLSGSGQFKGDLVKGIIIMGDIGTGKTVIMDSFIDVFNEVSDKIITSIHSKDVSRILLENEVGYLNKRPLFIDDIGKEQEAIKNYGTEVHPMEDLVNERYKNFALTFATTNYKFADMSYSRHTIDRMKQMLNVLILTGKSRRK